jgi:glycine/D-amino acid oxidase-like deaminating enzyme
MAADLDGDLGVDVLIIGGGIQGLYLARALHKQFSVCVVTDPHAPSETLDSPGFFSAGYTGNDVARIQPARRAAGYWKLWAESNGVPNNYAPSLYVMPQDEEGMRTRLWSDAQLVAKRADSIPQIFGRGSLEGEPAFETLNDVVMNPTDFLAELRKGLEDNIIWGEVTKFGLITDKAIDFIEVQTSDERIVPITARYVVLVSDVGNGYLLQRLVATFKDRGKRQAAAELTRGCQAVRRVTTIVVRGTDLPLVAGWFDGLEVTAHPFGKAGENVWVVRPPIDDRSTVLGPEEIRFEPKLDAIRVTDALDRIFRIAPQFERLAPKLQWGAYTARKTEHPMMAVASTANVAQPAPARLETFDMEGFVAAWPSHLAYAMIVGDVVAERVQTALSKAADFSEGPQIADFAAPSAGADQVARWEQPTFKWLGWTEFQEVQDYKRG